METEMKRLPKGISDYKNLRLDNYYYVDKTMYLPKLEEAGPFLFMVRPRRFGKSLFLNMLSCYYDVAEKDNFDCLFGDTWIAKHPTRDKNRYLMLRLDFSQVGGSAEDIEQNFDLYAGISLDTFTSRYRNLLGEDVVQLVKEQTKFLGKFTVIVQKAKEKRLPIYLIVDEYDNFTNNVLNSEGNDRYRALTHGEGFYRELFKKFKGNFPKILMLGVSPVTLDDLTSGYNIASNISIDPRFNMMLGFSENDVREMIEYYRKAGKISRATDDIITEMKPWYDGYCFAKQSFGRDPKMFNSDMVLYYLDHLMSFGETPEFMVDPNTRTDYKKMKRIIQLDHLDGDRLSLIHQIAEEGFVYGSIVPQFPADRLMRPENFLSLLFYYGMLTITSWDGLDLQLGIPNNNVREQYYQYLLEEFTSDGSIDTSALSRLFRQAAKEGDWRPLLESIMEGYEKHSAVRSQIEGERNMQGWMLAVLTMSPLFLTAPEMELKHGYCDFFLMPNVQRYPMLQHGFIIELKYLRSSDTDEVAQKQWNEAVEQINRYAQDSKIPHYLQGRRLHKIIVQVRGLKAVRMEEVE